MKGYIFQLKTKTILIICKKEDLNDVKKKYKIKDNYEPQIVDLNGPIVLLLPKINIGPEKQLKL